jgi:hypothetical protein
LKAEAEATAALDAKRPIGIQEAQELDLRATYAGGHPSQPLVQILLFNSSKEPIYIAAWFAKWEVDGKSRFSDNAHCFRGDLPKRLESQDRHDLIIDITEATSGNLQSIGVCDAKNRRWVADEGDILAIVDNVRRYEALSPRPDTTSIEKALVDCDVDIQAVVVQHATGKRLVVKFANRSAIPISLTHAEVAWRFEPPRGVPTNDVTCQVARAGGSATLNSSTALANPIEPGVETEFYLATPGLLIDTLFADVPNEAIELRLFTNSRFVWTPFSDEIADAVREVARYALEAGN